MSRWVWLLLASGCVTSPSPESVACYSRCARYKDSCLLASTNAQQVQTCDERGALCSAGCP
ncbi:MAG: hypothetical protein EOO73_15930 [Myxococcales bacterium]|nr:MAG: hypothetical protein EOO73_15930 [Myxococcales bacterium]